MKTIYNTPILEEIESRCSALCSSTQSVSGVTAEDVSSGTEIDW